MGPEDKVACVKLHMEAGSIVAMCGDGGNDCAALRASHVGLALSDSDASIVSPFSTSTGSVVSLVELLRQGRSALATSLASFKFTVVYGETLVFSRVLLYLYSVFTLI
jgi:cation-transporting ATPase 13A3/4/5